MTFEQFIHEHIRQDVTELVIDIDDPVLRKIWESQVKE